MNPDLDNLITVDAQVQQNAEHGSVDLLRPFISILANSGKVSRLKLKAGNEAGVSLSLDGNHLMFDFSAYDFIQSGDNEELCYDYRINDARGRYSHASVTIILSRNEHDHLSISTASLTTNQPLDYDPASEEASTDNTDHSQDAEDELPHLSTEKLVAEDEPTTQADSGSAYDSYEPDNIEMKRSDDFLDDFSEPLAEIATEDNEQKEPEDPLFDLDDEESESISLTNNNDDFALFIAEDEPVTQDQEKYGVADSTSDGITLEESDYDASTDEPLSLDDQQDHLTWDETDNTNLGITDEEAADSEPAESFTPYNDETSESTDETETDDSSVTFHFTPQSEEQEDQEEESESVKDAVEEDTALAPFNYEELASELPLTEEADKESDIDLDQIISEVDQAISEADRLMDSTLGINDETDKTYSTELGLLSEENEDSPEHALNDLIGSLPEDNSEEDTDSDHEAEEDLEHLIERLPSENSNTGSEEEENGAAHEGSYAPNKTIAVPESFFGQPMIIDGTSSHIFDLIDFDPNRLGLSRIRIDELPSSGALFYNKELAETGQEVNTTELLTGRLSFNPDSSNDIPETTEFSYSICFGDQHFKPLTSCNLSVAIDISANTEDSLVGSGDVVIVDAGGSPPDFIAGTITGEYGELTINNNGYWVYEADRNQSALKSLTHDKKLTETLSVSTEDKASYTLAFYITGPYEATKLITTS